MFTDTNKPKPVTIDFGGIRWTATPRSDWYWHSGDLAVFPYDGYLRTHNGHAVMPVTPTSILTDDREEDVW